MMMQGNLVAIVRLMAWACLGSSLLQGGLLAAAEPAEAKPVEVNTGHGDELLSRYFAGRTRELADRTFADINSLQDWEERRPQLKQQLFEMLGLDPLPERTPLKATVTGTVDHPEFTVEKVHFQSRPGLYVTGNLYVPKQREGRLPAVLYVCGHGASKKDGISYGNKVSYQHHGGWFARNGYVCLTIDTLQMGEIEGIHHGTYHFNRFWWNARGYTPAGVEAWNCIRALDYLQSRPEVDGERLGVTGRSGGGAYSWWIAAIDERIKVAVPVAGITSLENHVVDGVVEGHCDCMYQLNTYAWDYPMIAALVAPRPLLISNTDKDRIFPLHGVVEVYSRAKKIYDLYRKPRQIGLQITEGPHKDTQNLRIHAFHWFNQYLKGQNPSPLIETAAVKFFQPEELKVFDELPADEQNTTIDETFTIRAETPAVPETPAEWESLRDRWMGQLREKTFRGWPAMETLKSESPLKPVLDITKSGIRLTAYDFDSQPHVPLRLFLAHRDGLDRADLKLVVLNALNQSGWEDFLTTMKPGFAEALAEYPSGAGDPESFESNRKMFAAQPWAMAWVAPRGIGPTEWNRDERKRVHIRRRFMQLGQTLDGMRTWDVVATAAALRRAEGMAAVPLWMQGEDTMAGVTLYASLFVPDVVRLDLWRLPQTHTERPIYLNVLRFLDMPQAVAMAAARSRVRLYQGTADGWEWPEQVAAKLKLDPKQIQVLVMPAAGAGEKPE
ncbi:MAG: acetylxylan esterase [Planctomycetaceae bacterium]|nr:acetylxylan esterase [Planctomycetaceae bacterium]